MRESYIHNGSLSNIKRIHWIFYELLIGTHQDVLPQRRSHMDMVVEKVEHAMNITWAKKKRARHLAIGNDKKQTIIKVDGSKHKIRPLVKSPKTHKESEGNPNYKRGKQLFYWYSKAKGIHWVS
jgi:hypothetical protein